MNNNSTVDNWFKTWPIRLKTVHGNLGFVVTPTSYEEIKNHIMSLDVLSDTSDNESCLLSSFRTNGFSVDTAGEFIKNDASPEGKFEKNKNLTLDTLLESLPLVYNPCTKQLQVVKLKSRPNGVIESVPRNSGWSKHYAKGKNSFNDSNVESYKFPQDERCELISKPKPDCQESCLPYEDDVHFPQAYETPIKTFYHNLNDEKPLTSSITVNSLNESLSIGSGSSFCSSSTDKLQSSPTISTHLSIDGTVHRDPVSSPATIASTKKKGIAEFFTRKLLPWRTKNNLKTSTSNADFDRESITSDFSSLEDTSSSWKLFPKTESLSSLHSGESKIPTHEMPTGSAGLIMEERPGNLPAKTPLEQEKHKQEYNNIVTAAKKKEMKEARDRRKAQTLQLKQEKVLSDSVHTWNTVILPKWNSMRNHKKCQDLWWSGLPSCVRGKVWKLAIGNELRVDPKMYSVLVQRSLDKLVSLTGNLNNERDTKEVSIESKNQESTLKLIQLDVSRTFPQLCIFQNGGPFHDPLHNILGAYVCFRPDVGYVQGMSFLAATLLLNMEECEAFIYFCNLIARPLHMAFFTVNQRIMQAYFITFEQLLRENLPSLADHLKELNVSPSMYFLDWVLTVFARSLPLDVTARMWDIYLRDGEEFLFRAAIGILKHFEKELLEEDCTALTAQFLTRLPDDVCMETLFKDIASVPVVSTTKKRYRDVIEANVRRMQDSV